MRKYKKTIIAVLMLSVITIAARKPAERYFEIAKNLDIFATLFKEVNAFYVDEVDPDKLIRAGIDSMLASLDPYTNYIPEDELESFRTMTTGQYAGVGALIGQVNGKKVITMPYEGFAANRAGIKIGDELLTVDGVDVAEKSIPDISNLLQGPAKTEVNIKIKRYGEDRPLEFSFDREEITVSNVPYYGLITPTIGYISLEEFTTNAGKEVDEAVRALKSNGAKSIVLDLRNNPGGLLSEAVNVANVFIPRGKEVVSTKGKVEEWNKEYKTLNNATDSEIPLVVLANSGSASAAEIVSGVMQDYDRGVLIGAKTFGKGLVQTTRPLSYNSQLKVTTAKYYIPSGRCIQALDYAHRNEDGSVNKIADSLKLEFKTLNGRSMYDGEGLSPDIGIAMNTFATITGTLVIKGLIFDYATQYVYENEIKVNPADFKISEEEYIHFKKWLSSKEYDYTTSVEDEIEELIASAKDEKYYADIKGQLDKLKVQVAHSKEDDLNNFKEEIKQILEMEIMSRVYYDKGAIESSFDNDIQIQKAIKVLSDQTRYNQILGRN